MNESLSSMIVPGVLWALVLFSVVSWALLLIKSSQYLRQKSQNNQFTKAFWAACTPGAPKRKRKVSASKVSTGVLPLSTRCTWFCALNFNGLNHGV